MRPPGDRNVIARLLGVMPSCAHEWEWWEDADHDYTGYLERCSRCGEIVQVPQ